MKKTTVTVKTKKTLPRKPSATIHRSHSKFIVLFIALAVAVIFGIAYFAFTKTIIFLTTDATAVETTFEVQVAEKVPLGTNTIIQGLMISAEDSTAQEFTVNDVVSTVPDFATGTVTLHNDYSQSQPLVATTRLLSSEGVLFRTTETIRVNPGETVTVPVKADLAGESGNIPESRFTIVALWPGIQDKIYGTSDAPMTGGLRDVRAITESELTEAKQAVTVLAEQKIKTRLQELLALKNPDLAFSDDLFTTTASEVSASHNVNDEIEKYSVSVKLSATGFALDTKALETLSQDRLLQTLPVYQKILPNSERFDYTVVRIDTEKNEATVKVTADGMSDIALSHPLFDTTKLTNMDKDDLRSYFADIPEVLNIDVTFSPFWSFKTPRLPDHITIRLVP